MPNKSLGQHWLTDRLILEAIVDCAAFTRNDTVLEVGPGLGTLTSAILAQAGKVIAVEFDPELARKLPGQFPGTSLEVVRSDILSYDTRMLPEDVVVIGNIPYYITNKIVRTFTEGPRIPKTVVLLIQKEVAERIASSPGDLSVLAISAQIAFDVQLGPDVPAAYFTPPPKVDSQVIVMHRREQPLVPVEQRKKFFRLVKAGFSAKRKKLRSALAGGLAMDKTAVEKMLDQAGIPPDVRAQELSIADWLKLLELLV